MAPLMETFVEIGLDVDRLGKDIKGLGNRFSADIDRIAKQWSNRLSVVVPQAALPGGKGLWDTIARGQEKANKDAKQALDEKLSKERAFMASLKSSAELERERLRIMLGENDALDEQVRKAIAITNLQKGLSVRAVPLPGQAKGAGGGPSSDNQARMNAAQLSYAIQDFATGIAMGNFNMAVMGASNNLGMLAMSFSPVTAGLTVIGASLLPHATAAIEKWDGQAERAARQVSSLSAGFKEFHETLSQGERIQTTAFKVSQMEDVSGVETRTREIENEKKIAAKSEDILLSEISRRRKLLKQSRVEQGMGFRALDFIAYGGGPTPEQKSGATRVVTQEGAAKELEIINQLVAEIEKARKSNYERLQEEAELQKKVNDLQGDYMTRLTMRALAPFNSPGQVQSNEAFMHLQDRQREIRRNLPEGKLRNDALDLETKSYRGRLDMIKQEEHLRRQTMKDQLSDIFSPNGPKFRAIDREHEERKKNIDREFADNKGERDRMNKLNDAAHVRQRRDEEKNFDIRQSNLKARLAGGLDKESGEKMAIEAGLKSAVEEINKMGLPEAQRRMMLAQAHGGALKQLADVGPKTSFAGIAGLSSQIQQNLTDGTQYQKEIADLTKGVKKATENTEKRLDDIIRDGLRIQGGGMPP